MRKALLVLTSTCFLGGLPVGARPANLYEAIISPDAACRELFWRGVEAIGAEKLKDAEKDLKAAVKIDGNCFLAYILLSQIAYVYKDDRKATAYLERIPPEPPELAALYEDLVTALRADDYDRLAAGAAALLAAYPQTMTAVATLHLLARAQYYAGAKDEALQTFKAAFMYSELAPGTVPAYGSQAEMIELETFAGRR